MPRQLYTRGCRAVLLRERRGPGWASTPQRSESAARRACSNALGAGAFGMAAAAVSSATTARTPLGQKGYFTHAVLDVCAARRRLHAVRPAVQIYTATHRSTRRAASPELQTTKSRRLLGRRGAIILTLVKIGSKPDRAASWSRASSGSGVAAGIRVACCVRFDPIRTLQMCWPGR